MQDRKRTTLYIDAANLIKASQKHIKQNYDIFELLVYLKDRYRINNCIYFTGNIKSLTTDYELLKSFGVEIVFKKIYFEGGKTKANCDVEISHRITKDVENNLIDNIVLLSGDGDFAALLDYANERLEKVQLFSVIKYNTSKLLRSRRYLNVTYLNDLIDSIKRKGPTGHVVQAGRLFDAYSVANTEKLSSGFIVVYSTFKDRQQAEEIVKVLLEEKLIACANYFGVEAAYFWKEKLANEKEVATFLKTRAENWKKLKDKILEMHSYEIPCIIKFEVQSNTEYDEWIKSSTDFI